VSECSRTVHGEHELELRVSPLDPTCRPLTEQGQAILTGFRVRPLGAHRAQWLADEWECYHFERCGRCRKITRRILTRSECPTACAQPSESGTSRRSTIS
jgi:hypothetical protein